MCTLSWLQGPGGYTLWHSRDERRTRGPALPPEIGSGGDGVSWIAPRDTDAGGTWVGVNTRGVTVGIANLFLRLPPLSPDRKQSRGLLVRDLLDSRTAAEAVERVGGMDLSRFEPFTLAAVDEAGTPGLLRWDRAQLRPVAPLGPVLLVTSAGPGAGIERGRKELFERESAAGHLTSERLEALYRAPPTPDSVGLCVQRSEVGTVSLTRVDVRAGEVSLTYTPGPPCRVPAGPAVTLRR